MSRRLNGLSALDEEFARRGLVRISPAVKLLRVDFALFRHLLDQNQVRTVTFEWKGTKMRGIPHEDLDRLLVKMWGSGGHA